MKKPIFDELVFDGLENLDWFAVRDRFRQRLYGTSFTLTLSADMHSRLLTLQDIADILGLSIETVRGWPSKCPDRLPPRTYIAGDVVRFDPKAVEDWINGHLGKQKKKVGRPRRN